MLVDELVFRKFKWVWGKINFVEKIILICEFSFVNKLLCSDLGVKEKLNVVWVINLKEVFEVESFENSEAKGI